ncbi:MAG TPA: MFS transporter [Mycobacteriales bacterium]|nr:MFS transporter [Mycobacteriales bacterium]
MFRSLRVRNYRLYASGQIVSLTGTWMQRVAQDWLVLNLSHNSGTALGVVTALQFTPTLLLGLWGGVLADRYDKRTLLVFTQSTMGLLALVLGLLDATGVVALWQVFMLAAILGTSNALDVPVRQSFVTEMVGRDELTNAVSLNSATFNSARIVGPAVAGLMINWVGTGPVFFVNAASVVAVLTGLALMRPAELYRGPSVPRARGQLRAGLRYVRSRADLVVPMLLVFVVGTFGLNFQITLALMAKQVFGLGAGSYGLLSTSLAVGSLAGALLSTRRKRRPRLRFLIVAACAFGLAEVLAGLMPTYPSLALMLVPAGAAALTFTIAANSTVQMGTEPTMRGRVMALYLLCFLGGTPVGAPLIGTLAEHFGARASLIVGGAVSAAAALTVGVLLARRRGMPVDQIAAELRRHGREPVSTPAGHRTAAR